MQSNVQCVYVCVCGGGGCSCWAAAQLMTCPAPLRCQLRPTSSHRLLEYFRPLLSSHPPTSGKKSRVPRGGLMSTRPRPPASPMRPLPALRS